jgi:hypothetical protein
MANSSETDLQDKVLHSEIQEFGSVALLYDIANRLDIVKIIDDVVPKRNQGTSVGMYCLIEAINRAVNPVSTKKLSDWFTSTALPIITGNRAKAFSAQNFWNNTSISKEQIDLMETNILNKILETYSIDTSQIIYDATYVNLKKMRPLISNISYLIQMCMILFNILSTKN